MSAARRRSRLRLADTVSVAAGGLRIRSLRAALSSLGIAVGIAALVGVLGISNSSQADLLAELGAEANLLTVASGQSFSGQPAPLPAAAAPMVRRMAAVDAVAAVGLVPGATVRRTAAIPPTDTGGITVIAADRSLLDTLGGSAARGAFLNAATERYPAVVLGSAAARTLGIASVPPATQVYLGGRYFTVVGILDPVPLAPEIDDAALVGFPVADAELGLDGRATKLYLRADPDQVSAVARLLPFTANPAQPEGVEVSHPSDVLVARAQARTAFTGSFLGLGAVAVLVGTIGIANVMVISVLERRTEIGLRRALGATRGQIGRQFLAESILLAGLGAGGGLVLGAAATAAYASFSGGSMAIPPAAIGLGLGTGLLAGTLAGLYPARRAARLTPTEALRSA